MASKNTVFNIFIMLITVLAVIMLTICISILIFSQPEVNTTTEHNINNVNTTIITHDYSLNATANPVDIVIFNTLEGVEIQNTTTYSVHSSPFYIKFANPKHSSNLMDLSSRSLNADVTLRAPDNVLIYTTDSKTIGQGNLSEHFKIPTDSEHDVIFSTKTNKEGNYTVTMDIEYWYGDDKNTSKIVSFNNTISTIAQEEGEIWSVKVY